ncbi:carbon-nitrogen hydrolase family protein [Methylococcus sp. EFPC2]|uniref:carbon-nitrogen hydrolase family protein n=1 Tax=Methylococcus sp. EFPC2 TaxID=2812648 RepID=UPI00196883A9|nr:carbon-nitrogen hydrolase family protein [Methylococcus sp. EFPC2]QSA97089.1 carbon-nitrogen hydrolase family protein [Methylococcus sp. EFPC2]
MTKTVCAAVQMASSPNVGANLIEAGRLVAKAAEQKAGLVVLPENFAIMGMSETDKLSVAEPDGAGPIQEFLSKTAEKHKVWLVGGTIPVQAGAGKVRATTLVFNSRGERVGRYDKIHLFDVDVPGSNEQYRESNTIEPGEQALVVDTPFGRLGVAICYDLRFPELFRQLADHGMDILAVPAAFTARTGAAHWDILVRARAVENLCYTIASNQGGFHVNGRETYGHSMIVDPWGKVLASQPSGSGVVVAEVDSEQLTKVRITFPALHHRRLYCR